MKRNILTAAILAALAVTAGRLDPVYQVPQIDANGIGQMVRYPYYMRKIK